MPTPAWRRARLPLVVAALATSAVVTLEVEGGGEPQPVPPATHDAADAVADALRMTVTLESDGVYGAGILVDPREGLVLTSHHVVSDMRSPRVTAYDGRVGTGRLAAVDPVLDLALLRVPSLATRDGRRPLLGDVALLRPGEDVYAIGSPRKLPFTVSRGIVSYVGREMDGVKYLQLDMAINDGNSGGPVIDRRGRIVGVMSFVLRRAQGLAFAVPVATALSAFPGHLAGR